MVKKQRTHLTGEIGNNYNRNYALAIISDEKSDVYQAMCINYNQST